MGFVAIVILQCPHYVMLSQIIYLHGETKQLIIYGINDGRKSYYWSKNQ